MEEDILCLKNLTKMFGNRACVSEVNMNIKKGDIYGFIGRNGAGKTTTLKMIVGLTEPTSGNITLFGSNKLNNGRHNTGTVIESPAFVPHLSARDNMYIQWRLLDSKNENIIDETLEMVGLRDVGNKKAKDFSLGMKQRLGIGMALMGEPEFLVLDEPVNGLDPEGIISVRSLLKKLNEERGVTILISSHLLNELSRLATRYGIINNGKMVDEFSLNDLDERCESHLEVKVDDLKKAESLIKGAFSEVNIKVIPVKNIIEIYGFTGKPGDLTKVLAMNDVLVESIRKSSVDLEDYFMKAIGGESNG